jgi:hypothetical protein
MTDTLIETGDIDTIVNQEFTMNTGISLCTITFKIGFIQSVAST